MVRLFFYVEGQSEEAYVKLVLAPHLAKFGVNFDRSIRAASGKKRDDETTPRGGGFKYKHMRKDLGLVLACHKQPEVRVSTMFDLYHLYAGFPGWDEAEKIKHIPSERVRKLEAAFAADVNDPRFIPHIQLYEFETILLCNPEMFRYHYESCDRQVNDLKEMVVRDGPPEQIDDGPHSAPSKRIDAIFHGYKKEKITAGVDIASLIPLELVRQKCPHFDEWLKSLEALAPPVQGAQP